MSPSGRALLDAAKGRATISDALQWASQLLELSDGEETRIVAEVLLCHALEADRSNLYARLYSPLAEDAWAGFQRLVDRRLAGEPVAYIRGLKEFYGLTLRVDRRVLIPRPETESLVHRALEISNGKPLLIADIGTGSGAIAIALAVNAPLAKIYATDLSPEVLELARANARLHQVADRITFLAGDLLEPLPCQADLIVANLPYVPDDEVERLSTSIRDFEPLVALKGGEDGLALYRRFLAAAPTYLRSGGAVLCELGWGQIGAAVELARTAFPSPSFGRTIQVYRDFAGYERGLEIAT